ncbi:MAG: hypothetical protein EOO75_17955 [Myxococcales bacterium]|nr:MAG: hypothetical protein EOO75_17955 [Myxococcales bacterium]
MTEKDISDPKVGVALVLTCMDLRVLDEAADYLEALKLTNEYDHFVLAGAALGVTQTQKPAWGETFWDHLGLAIGLHQISKVFIFEHQDCGAYKKLVPDEAARWSNGADEKACHHGYATALQKEILRRHAGVITDVELRYIAIEQGTVNGHVETF